MTSMSAWYSEATCEWILKRNCNHYFCFIIFCFFSYFLTDVLSLSFYNFSLLFCCFQFYFFSHWPLRDSVKTNTITFEKKKKKIQCFRVVWCVCQLKTCYFQLPTHHPPEPVESRCRRHLCISHFTSFEYWFQDWRL